MYLVHAFTAVQTDSYSCLEKLIKKIHECMYEIFVHAFMGSVDDRSKNQKKQKPMHVRIIAHAFGRQNR